MSFLDDWQWANKFVVQIEEILRQNAMHLITFEIAREDDDCKHATDLIVSVKGGNVAVRSRRCNIRYRDMTLRVSRGSGAKTELEKIREGFADWYLYTWVSRDEQIKEWILVDLNTLRRSGLLDKDRRIIPNNDREQTAFIAISIPELRCAGCISASYIEGWIPFSA